MKVISKNLLVIAKIVIIVAMFICVFSSTINVYAEGKTSELQKIEQTASDEFKKAKTPKAAIGVINGTASDYIFYSKSNDKNLNENALFQLGSVSKAFTALGILLLEDEGLLSLSDPISKHLPWFKVNFDGKQVEDYKLTIENLVYQTSGFISNDKKFPGASKGMSLQENVRQHIGKNLMFYPGERYAYSNVNYVTLGLIIEVVTGQSYEKFITNKILHPLGLYNTYANLKLIPKEKEIVKGTKLSFFNTYEYEIAAEQGNVPAGYIYSSLADVCRWTQIQLGEIVVLNSITKVIKKSHIPSSVSKVSENIYYAAGWFVNTKTNEVYHSGGTVNYSTNISMRMDSKIASCVLTNLNASANTNNVASNVLNIIDGKSILPYQTDIWMVFDVIFSSITIVGGIAIIMILFLLVINIYHIKSGKKEKTKFAAKSLLKAIPALLLSILTISVVIIVPLIFGSTWVGLGLWAPSSLIWGLSILVVNTILLLSFSIINILFKKNKAVLMQEATNVQ